MSRIEQAFLKAKAENRGTLITYICAGDPDLETTKKLVLELSHSGADIIELGIPFSDPIADGPTIQRAGQRALKHNTSLNQILDLAAELRQKTEIPLVLMGYYNPILHLGLNTFAQKAKVSGIDGVIIPDLPPDEAEEWIKEARAGDIDTIFLLAPTSNEARIKIVTTANRGFNYYVSVMGVTGSRTSLQKDISSQIKLIRTSTKLPIAVGFGISNPDQVRDVLATGADGVIVGSAIIDIIEKNLSQPDLVNKVAEFVRTLATGLKHK
jgi:tryptophan synthase alpha chain